MITGTTRKRTAPLTAEDTAILVRAERRWSSLVAMLRGDRGDAEKMYSLVDAGTPNVTVRHSPACPCRDYIRPGTKCDCDFGARLRKVFSYDTL